MEGKYLKRGLMALLALAFCVTLTFGVMNAFPVFADEDGVLPGNTATYTFENDPSNPWLYNRAANTWESAIQGINNGETTLTLTATSDGDVVFDYRVSSEKNSDKLTIKMEIIKSLPTRRSPCQAAKKSLLLIKKIPTQIAMMTAYTSRDFICLIFPMYLSL